MLYFPNSFLQNRNDHWQTPFIDIYFSVRFAPYIVRLNCWIDREYEWFVKIVTTNKQLIQYWDLLGLKLSTTSNLKKNQLHHHSLVKKSIVLYLHLTLRDWSFIPESATTSLLISCSRLLCLTPSSRCLRKTIQPFDLSEHLLAKIVNEDLQ